VPTLGEATRQRLRVLGLTVPAWSVVAVLVLGAAAVGVIVPRGWAPPPEPPAPAVSAERPAAPPVLSPPTASSARPVSMVERARHGELIALKQLERHPCPERPIEETIALASGHAALKHADLAALVHGVQADPTLLDDVNTVRLLHDYASDPEVAIQALEAIARFEHPVAPDLLFDIWNEGKHAASGDLAADLIHHKSVREHATPALEIALSLLETKNCRKLAKLLPNALEHADRRAKTALEKLERKKGCGPKQDEDCYPCLRDSGAEQLLRDSIAKARATPAPRPWRSRKVQDF
jgi:hypothetical protein